MRKLLFGIPFILAVAASAQPPQVVTRSEVSEAGRVEVVDTLDSAPLYRLTVNLDPKSSRIGMSVEYEIFTASGTALGGGMFTIEPKMLSPGGGSLSVLTGFGGLELEDGSRIVVQVVDPASTEAPANPRRAIGASGIADT